MSLSRLVDTALCLSRVHEYDPTHQTYMAALIVKGGRTLSVGFNSRRSSGLQEHYKLNAHQIGIHAEIDAILSARRKIDLQGSKIIVVRRLKNDTAENPAIGLAKPCVMCQAVLYSYGIKRAHFTVSNTEVGSMKIVDPRNGT